MTSWQDKLSQSQEHKFRILEKDISGMKAGQRILIPSATQVDSSIRKLSKGEKLTPKTLRQKMAEEFGAQATCPVTLGFHLRTVAEACYEAYEAGVQTNELTPIWRVLDKKAPTLKKLSFDPEFLLSKRSQEEAQ